MSQPELAKPVRLVISLFLNDRSVFPSVVEALVSAFGPIDSMSRWFPFHATAYYGSETGNPLFRRILTFSTLVDPMALAGIKLETNAIEDIYRTDGNRRVNLDPGYLTPERFVLATGKNFTHRIYIGQGIYADLTLIFQQGAFKALPWSYAEYADAPIADFLTHVRLKLMLDTDSGNGLK